MATKDKYITCIDCGCTFSMTEEEQKWYEERGFELPKRCPECRKAKRNKNRNSGLKGKGNGRKYK